jgi:MFS family permease
VALATLLSILTSPWVFSAFILALVAVAFSSADIPNRNAILTDVNLPEHRGTAVGFLTIAVGLGLAGGNAFTGLVVDWLSTWLTSPWNYAVGLALFQLIFIPAAICFYALSKATPADIAAVRRTLRDRGKLTITP